ncbi:protein-disulfide reductase DsbD family protein [Chlamydiifrater phoenicopteri]|uniref:protein-disulfide reductase DsbD family protein n=1 Tax=Chlamydiifrater phoenicopteri TaxID=2681469 RepID=UPI001BCD22DC|nr:cytochrome c biogenesis protein CcdA [Chlamydiifrater phoenicopteri]
MSKIKPFLAVFWGLLFALPQGSQGKEGLITQTKASRAALISESAHISETQPFHLAVKLKVPEGGHIYWKNPGEIGQPLEISWNVPPEFRIAEEFWPCPEIFKEADITSYGYTGSILVIAKVVPTQKLIEGKHYSFKAKANWLACIDSCEPEEAEMQLFLQASSLAPKLNNESAADFAQTLLSLPRAIDEEKESLVAFREEEKITILLQSSIASKICGAEFIPETKDLAVDYSSEQQFSSKGEEKFSLIVKTTPGVEQIPFIKGVLLLKDESGNVAQALAVNTSFDEKIPGLSDTTDLVSSSFLLVLISAFLGGLLLNIMPCVLPLITLKVYGLVKSSGEHHRSVVKNSLAFVFGVVGCFWVLGLVAASLKFLGHNVGWGFQLQEPTFLMILILSVFLFALSSLGLFELGTIFVNLGSHYESSHRRSGYAGAFFNGVLATLITTPCTGPFLGSVLGLVMSLSVFKQMSIFTCMGLGMSSPYLLLALFPKLLSFLPKPGAWMGTFKQITGFLLMATAVWLIWVFGLETSIEAVNLLLAALLIAAFAVWVLGRWGTPVTPKKKRLLAISTALVILGLSLFLGVRASWSTGNDAVAPIFSINGWEKFSREKVDKYQNQGRGVFVHFTAKWCITCQVNKPILHAPGVQQFFKSRNIATLEADWTKKDPAVTEELARLGRASVPTYVYYPPGKNSKPILLPQNISQKIIETSIDSVS